jgi:hypothetical protein
MEIGCEKRQDVQAHDLCARSFSPSRSSFHTLFEIEPRFPFVFRFFLFLTVDRLNGLVQCCRDVTCRGGFSCFKETMLVVSFIFNVFTQLSRTHHKLFLDQ